jgi:hypothetical protein
MEAYSPTLMDSAALSEAAESEAHRRELRKRFNMGDGNKGKGLYRLFQPASAITKGRARAGLVPDDPRIALSVGWMIVSLIPA